MDRDFEQNIFAVQPYGTFIVQMTPKHGVKLHKVIPGVEAALNLWWKPKPNTAGTNDKQAKIKENREQLVQVRFSESMKSKFGPEAVSSIECNNACFVYNGGVNCSVAASKARNATSVVDSDMMISSFNRGVCKLTTCNIFYACTSISQNFLSQLSLPFFTIF
jgi:hypothetical protein